LGLPTWGYSKRDELERLQNIRADSKKKKKKGEDRRRDCPPTQIKYAVADSINNLKIIWEKELNLNKEGHQQYLTSLRTRAANGARKNDHLHGITTTKREASGRSDDARKGRGCWREDRRATCKGLDGHIVESQRDPDTAASVAEREKRTREDTA